MAGPAYHQRVTRRSASYRVVPAGGGSLGAALGGGRGAGLGGGLLRGLEEHVASAFGTDDQGGAAVPILDHLEFDEGGVGAEGLATDADGFGFAFGPDDFGLGIDLRFELGELGFGGFLFLNHFHFDGLLEFGREGEVVENDVDDFEEVGADL